MIVIIIIIMHAVCVNDDVLMIFVRPSIHLSIGVVRLLQNLKKRAVLNFDSA